MALRFRRSINIAPGIKLNFGKKSMSVSVGVRGAHYTVNTKGQSTRSVGIPGTGVSWITRSSPTRAIRSSAQEAVPRGAPVAPPKPGLFAPSFEKAFHAGVMAYVAGRYEEAQVSLESASGKEAGAIAPDLLAGVVANAVNDVPLAIRHLERVASSPIAFPDALFRKYFPASYLQASLKVHITPSVVVTLPLSTLAGCLLLAELYQQTGRDTEAIGVLQQLSARSPDDLTLRLSLSELLLGEKDFEGVVEVVREVAANTEVGFACRQFRAAALSALGMGDAALETLSGCLRSKVLEQFPELAKAIRYDRALQYAAAGRGALARRDFERIYASDPDFRDTRERLGVGVKQVGETPPQAAL